MSITGEEPIKACYGGRQVAGEYVGRRFTSELSRLLHDRQVRAVQQVIERHRPQCVLEIAPGPGRVTRDVQPHSPLVCLEYNEGMIEEGRRASNGKAVWVRGNGFQLPFGRCFDLVYCYRFIRHFHDTERKRLYAEIRRVLQPGGYFVFDAVNEHYSRPLREAHPDEYPVYDKLYRLEELCRELAKAGLEVLSLEPVQRCYRWQYQSQVFLGPRVNWLNRLVIRALEWLPGRDGLEWIVTCRSV